MDPVEMLSLTAAVTALSRFWYCFFFHPGGGSYSQSCQIGDRLGVIQHPLLVLRYV